MPGVTPSPIPIQGGENTSADPATQATTLVANTYLGPAGENSQRAGLVDYGVTGLDAPVAGMFQWQTWTIVVTTSRKVWALAQGAPTVAVALSDATAATQLAGTARPVFAEDGLPRLVIAGGNSPLQWTGAGLCSPLVTSGHTPAATHIAYLGQRLIANDVSNPTQWYWSDIGDGAHQSWTASQFTTADAAPDAIVGVYANIREAFVFGERTIQVYGVGEDPLNPFDNLNTLQVGCAAPYSPVNVDGQWTFLDDKRRIGITDGRDFTDVSQDVAKTLRGFTTVSDCWSYRQDINNQTLLTFVFPTEQRELVYALDRKAWTERDYYGAVSRGLRPISSYVKWDAFNIHLLGSSTAAAVYREDESTQTDLGNPLTMERVTGWLDHGTRSRKRSVRIRCVLRRGAGGPVGTAGQLELRVADDGDAWGAWEFLDLGLSGDSYQTVDAYVGGVFRRRRYHFRYSGTQDMALLSAEEQFQEVAS